MTDHDRRFADLAMRAANQRTHQMIEITALKGRIALLESMGAALYEDVLETAENGHAPYCSGRFDDAYPCKCSWVDDMAAWAALVAKEEPS